MQRRDWYPIAAMTAFVVALNVIGWGVLTLVVVPEHYSLGTSGVFGIGLGVTAFTLGVRHAFDADHIAAIDNTTRKLIADGQRPLTVGFWFSLGHSTVVFGLCLLLSFGVRALLGQLSSQGSTLHEVTGLIGILVSGVFLCLIALFNLVVLAGILKVFRGMREGRFDEAELEEQLNKRGLLNRILGKTIAAVRKPWHIYPVGVLFGLGFDTATEVGLLVLAGGAAAFALPWYAILVLPLLFAAGMAMFDAADGCFMNYAYGWASARPVRKIFYNIAVTGLTAVVALLIGGIELITVLVEQFGITSGPLAAIARIDLNYVGFVLVGLFVVTWAVALLVWRVGRFEERRLFQVD